VKDPEQDVGEPYGQIRERQMDDGLDEGEALEENIEDQHAHNAKCEQHPTALQPDDL
jgi:hypothetical protein